MNYSLLYASILSGLASFIYANPQNPQVIHGNVEIQNLGGALEIKADDRAVIHWENFSIGAEEVTRFIQPSAAAAVLNRVDGAFPSSIMGTLESNGNVYLINPNGVIIGQSGVIDTAALVVSTLDILDQDFIAGNPLLFTGDSSSSIVNLGNIAASDGDVTFIAYSIQNGGNIQAMNGECLFGAGQEVVLQIGEKEKLLVHLKSSDSEKRGIGIDQSGSIQALRAELKADGNPYALAIQHTGSIDALTVQEIDGEIFLIAERGKVEVDGALAAQGEIHVLGEEIHLLSNTSIDASGDQGGGAVFIGGGNHGNPLESPNADFLYVQKGSTIDASATTEGNGGEVVLWGTRSNQFYGEILSQGGSRNGNGGLVEISSKGALDPRGKVSTLAPAGNAGMLLFDPCAVTISSNPAESGFTGAPSYDFDASTAFIFNSNLVGFLGTTNVTIDASTGTAASGSITVSNDISWGSNFTLTLTANSTASDFILIDAAVTNSSGSFADATQVITITSPTVTIGDGLQTETVNVSISSGSMTITADTNFSMFGNPIFATFIQGTSAGTFTLTAGEINLNNPTPSPPPLNANISFTGTTSLTATTGDITLGGIFANINGGNGLGTTVAIDAMNGSVLMLPFSGSSGSESIGVNASLLSISAANQIQLTTGITNDLAGLGNASDSILLTASRIDIGDPAQMTMIDAGITAQSGNIHLVSSGPLNLWGGDSTVGNASCSIFNDDTTATPGGIIIEAESMLLQAGLLGTSDNIAECLTGGGAITISLVGDLTMNTENKGAGIFIARVGGGPIGDLTIQRQVVPGVTNIFLNGDNNTGLTGLAASNLLTIDINGDLTVTGTTNTGALQLIGGGAAQITVGGNIVLNPGNSVLEILSTTGNMNIQTTDLILNAGTASAAVVSEAGNVTIAARDITLTAGTAPIGILSETGNTTIGARDITISAGDGAASSYALIATAYLPGTTGSLGITARNITINGGSSSATEYNSAGIQVGKSNSDTVVTSGIGGNGTLTVNASGNITINGGSDNACNAYIATMGTAATNDISITCANLTLAGSSNGSLSNASAQIFAGENGVVGAGGGSLSIAASGSIAMTGTPNNPGQIYSNTPSIGDIQVIAGVNLSMDAGASTLIQALGLGNISLVVDNASPFNTPPNIGPGIFQSAGQITTSGGALWIFSSALSQTTITGTLNGLAFAPPANVVTPQWFSTFAGGGGFPFTVFIKGAIPPTITVALILASSSYARFQTSTSEALQDWRVFYDYYTLTTATTTVSYVSQETFNELTHHNKFSRFNIIPNPLYTFFKQLYNNGIHHETLSSFDVIPPTQYLIYRESYRNYDTLKLDNL